LSDLGTKYSRFWPRAFTLIEVLVVVAIIALLVAILLPSLGRARAQAKRIACFANMQQIFVAYTQYKDDNRDRIPDYAVVGNWRFRRAPGMKDPTSPTSLQETFGINALLAGVRPVESGNVIVKKKYLNGYSDVWRCPSAPSWMSARYHNTYAYSLLSKLGDIGLPTDVYSKLMTRRITSAAGKLSFVLARHMAILQDNDKYDAGLCGWMGSSSWTSAYKLNPEPGPPHKYKGTLYSGTDDTGLNVLYLDGHAAKKQNSATGF
jgi:prepilin-type N-terminal cleavage/methylation domain-containing protein/prepilin-type processing-associated H-X9-DG protein